MKEIKVNANIFDKPNIDLYVQRVEASAWDSLGFSKYHYLTKSINKSCKCLLFYWNDIPVGFVGILNSPRKGMPWGYSISRVVVLPDFQGLGISSKIINFCGGIIKSLGDDRVLYLKTIHDKMGQYMESSKNWEATSYNGKQRNSKTIDYEGDKYKNRLTRKSYCYKYVGNAIYGYQDLLLPIDDMRKNVGMKKLFNL